MPISVNWVTREITVPQSYLTLITGTLYELNTDTFRKDLKDLEDSEEGIFWIDTHDHNTQYTVAGITYARKVEIINGYTVEFEDGSYSVRLAGSNNNIFDVEGGVLVQNGVQVIPQNSAGLIVVGSSGGATAAEIADAVWDEKTSEHSSAGSFGKELVENSRIDIFRGGATITVSKKGNYGSKKEQYHINFN